MFVHSIYAHECAISGLHMTIVRTIMHVQAPSPARDHPSIHCTALFIGIAESHSIVDLTFIVHWASLSTHCWYHGLRAIAFYTITVHTVFPCVQSLYKHIEAPVSVLIICEWPCTASSQCLSHNSSLDPMYHLRHRIRSSPHPARHILMLGKSSEHCHYDFDIRYRVLWAYCARNSNSFHKA